MKNDLIRIEPVYKNFSGTVEKAISQGFESAMKDRGTQCDYEFRINSENGVKRILCELKLDNGYFLTFTHDGDPTKRSLSKIEKDAYQFLTDKL